MGRNDGVELLLSFHVVKKGKRMDWEAIPKDHSIKYHILCMQVSATNLVAP